MRRWLVWATLVLIVAGFCVRNLPWHLDNYDQAKQAFTSFEMVEEGNWFFQHTPTGRIATKPPLAGWISAAVYGVTRWWDLAWRLPSLVSALALMWLLWMAAQTARHPERSGAQRNGVESRVGETAEGDRWGKPRKNSGDPPADESLVIPRGPSTAQSFAAAQLCSARDDGVFKGGSVGVISPALIAVSAFGLNLFVPRLATLVRTDMLLTLSISLAGFLVFHKVRTASAWTTADRTALFVVLAVSMLTKGPVAYAFLVPGLIAFLFLMRRRNETSGAWCGWWPWIAPLCVFALWGIMGITRSDEFYQQVVVKEFLGRFTMGEEAVHNNLPPGTYTLGLLGRFAPWSLAIVALLFVHEVRTAIWRRPELLWLACWAGGGLLLMECVPSKRFDRIMPVVPPLCLLLAGMAAVWSSPWRQRGAGIAIGAALLLSGGYAAAKVVKAFRTDQHALARFGEEVRRTANAKGWRYGIPGTKDEGMMLYLRRTRFEKDAEKKWRRGELDGLVLTESSLKKKGEDFEPYVLLLQTAKVPEKDSRYFFIVRKDLAPNSP